ncbi:MAG TPA: hypothetical protein VEF06_15325 [Bryobacteraceae bacterium]|nr:hypothetical protein [Bryobacteraceae bacterium]
MLTRLWLIAAFAVAAASAESLSIRVTETAGIRRTAFPASARVHVGDTPARLSLNGKDVPAQFTAAAGGWLDVDWNVTIGPGETQTYTLEYGPSVKAAEPPRGLALKEEDDAVQIGAVRFSKSGTPLLLSVKYRGEEIGQGVNGVFVTDDAGRKYDLSKAGTVKVEFPKRGPLVASLGWSGQIQIDGNYSVPFTITAEMPNSKTWVKISASVEDPQKRVREIGVGTPLAFGPLPWVWDFGTARWTYGSLRNAADSVTMTQTAAGDWTVETGQQMYEKSPAGNTAPVEWGHFQDGKEVVAFALERGAQQNGTWRVSLDGRGQAMYRFGPVAPSTHHEFAVYQHFVTTPVQIGAATSPASILRPLEVSVVNP